MATKGRGTGIYAVPSYGQPKTVTTGARQVTEPGGMAAPGTISGTQYGGSTVVGGKNMAVQSPVPYGKAVADVNRQIYAANNQPQGMSDWEMLQAIMSGSQQQPGSSSRGSGGSRGFGGGGGGSAGPSVAELTPAYQAYLDSILGQDIAGQYAQFGDKLSGLYSNAGINKNYRQQVGAVQGASQAGNDRLAGIGQAMTDRAAQGATGINQAFQNGASQLDQLMAQYGNRMGSQNAGLNKILGANGAGQVGVGGAARNLNAFFGAAQGANAGAQNMFAQAAADRQSLAGNLQADVGLGISESERGMMNQLAANRGSAKQANNDKRAQLDAELFMRQMAAQEQQNQAANQFRLQAAQMGIKL